MNRNAVFLTIFTLLLAKASLAQSVLPKELVQKKDSVVLECNNRIVKSTADFDVLVKKIPGLTIGGNWENQDPKLLSDQEKIPSREEREKIYEALVVKVGCAQQLEVIGKPLMPELVIAFIDAHNYSGNYRFAKFLSQPTTYGEFNELRRNLRNQYLSDLSEIVKLLQAGTQDAIDNARKYVEKAEQALTNALSENEQLSGAIILSGNTYCRKLGVFDYCEKP